MSENGRSRARALSWPVRSGSSWPTTSFAPHWGVLQRLAAAETGPGRLFPWIPVAFGGGIALYFAAEQEPILWVTLASAVGLTAFAWLMRCRSGFALLALVAALIAGFAAATWKTARVSHDILLRPAYASSIRGFVETHEERERTDRFVLRVFELEGAGGAPKLRRVRLSVKKGTAPAVGDFVELKARLLPPLQPLRPGSYDFARDMYFQGIAASGFAIGAIQLREPPGSGGGVALRYAAAMQNLRDAIDARIRAVISGDARAIATALLTGRRDAISAPVNEAMFVSGLGHVLSISGYHMAVVAGVTFFAIRALLALVPGLAARRSIKKWAAASALIAAAFYLLLSGAEVATQRSFVMTAVVLVAVMVDRRAITFRTLALAAMAVLIVTPEALVHPSFQMSFAATLGLVALVNGGMPRLLATPDHSATARAALWGGRELMMLALASLIAGLATTPYAAFHFHRITPYGVFANLAAMPVVSAVVMPAGILGLVAMPFGLDGVFWRVMELGIGWMVLVAQSIAALPGSVGRIAAFGVGPLILSSAGIVLLGLLRTRLRWSGALLLVTGCIWAITPQRADVMIAADGKSVAVRSADGSLRILAAGNDAFLVREWLAAEGDGRQAGDPSLRAGTSCDDEGCVAPLKDGTLVALALKPDALADDCTRAAVIITDRAPPADCAALTVTADDLQHRGAVTLRRNETGFAAEAVRPRGVARPWSPTSATETARIPARVRAPRDATPAEADVRPDDQ